MHKVIGLPLFLSLILCFGLFAPVLASESLTVHSNGEVSRTIFLRDGDAVTGSVEVIAPFSIDFFITSPNGSVVLGHEGFWNGGFSFTANVTGTYVVHFVNPTSFVVGLSWSYSLISGEVWGVEIPSFFIGLVVGVVIGFGVGLLVVFVGFRSVRAKEKRVA